ncbi:MAG: tetratricopeptide repeat protein [Acidobacteria bacterium]|uniref:Tetratricopeptide repeat protein n=1 Tax=Candidatus Polarisedimenticola svalbardensis TaxID=2886004 RepID=A0A8J6XVQ4_9BACT|nr:tetratricopeptide repeat protein [Candidatus Polarisedimenticola svalbardensis]
MRKIRIVTCSLAILMLAWPVLARGIVSGQVTDRSGNILQGIQVNMAPEHDAKLRTYRLKTNKKGVYTFPADNGDYTITITDETWGLDTMNIVALDKGRNQVFEWSGKILPGQAPNIIGVSSGYVITVDLVVAHHSIIKEEHGKILLGTVVQALEAGNREEAAATVEKLLTESPDDPIALTLRAYMLMERGETEKAEADLNHALEVDPKFGDALFQLGTIYVETDRKDDALALFLRVANSEGLDDLTAKAWVQAGEMQRDSGDLEQAISSFSSAAALSPEMSPILSLEIAGLYTRLGEEDLAEHWLSMSGSESQQDPSILYNIAVSRFNEKAWEEASGGFRKVIAADGGFADAYRNLGYCLLNLGDRGEAIENFRKYLELSPDAPDAGQIEGLLAALEK